MIVFGSSLSPFVRKVLAFGAEKGLDMELQAIGLGSEDPDFCAASPFRKMPGFKDGDFSICDSSAIVHYLDAKFPEPNLIPTEPRARARTIWFDEFGDTIVMGCGGKMFFNRVVAPRFLGREGDLALAGQAEKEELPPILDYLETIVPESGFLVEDRLTLGDIAVASPFVNLGHMGVQVDAARWPKARAYVDGILARPSFAPWIERERAFFAKAA